MYGIQSYCEDKAEISTPFGTQDMHKYLHGAELAKDHHADAEKYKTTQCIVSAGLSRLNDDALFELGSDIGSRDWNRTRSMRGLPTRMHIPAPVTSFTLTIIISFKISLTANAPSIFNY
ncbi:hypothetical protein BPOR_0012g00490 [Botrytis porri]|uniref:Uncharacterized protein n=1 Tax=Botrytis porri TaxID=87229 RepID=A0A4Z1L5D2_9HELO|nr:hypothetical protein BPOR_0012g00490 [Botrytis porri]